MTKRDYYGVLGVPRQATRLEIRRAYRRLARQYSPDVNVWDDRGSGLFEELTEAYRVLSDPSARGAYDHLGHQAFGPQTESAAPGVTGEDLHYPIEMRLEDALHGVSIVVDVTRQDPCAACRASGSLKAGAAPACPACGGRPIRIVMRQGGPATTRCEACQTTGWRPRSPCRMCGGGGTVPGLARIPVRIPPGVDTAAQIRIANEGHAAAGTGRRGDLVVMTRVRPHPLYSRKGDNLYCEIPITIPEAVLGARIQVPTLDGPGVVTIPAGTQSGQVFRIRGKGWPRLDRDGRGDLFVATRVTIPRNADSTLEGLLRTLQRLLPDDPRAELWHPRGAKP